MFQHYQYTTLLMLVDFCTLWLFLYKIPTDSNDG